MKKFFNRLLIYLSTMLIFSSCTYAQTTIEDNILQIDYRQVLTDSLTNEVYNYIAINTKHDSEVLTEITEHIVNRALDKDIDICFILAQGHFETQFGTTGIGKSRKSIFGVYKTYDSYKSGIEDYLNILERNYLIKRNEHQLMQNYVNFRGARYAENPNYEIKLRKYYADVINNSSIIELQNKIRELDSFDEEV